MTNTKASITEEKEQLRNAQETAQFNTSLRRRLANQRNDALDNVAVLEARLVVAAERLAKQKEAEEALKAQVNALENRLEGLAKENSTLRNSNVELSENYAELRTRHVENERTLITYQHLCLPQLVWGEDGSLIEVWRPVDDAVQYLDYRNDSWSTTVVRAKTEEDSKKLVAALGRIKYTLAKPRRKA